MKNPFRSACSNLRAANGKEQGQPCCASARGDGQSASDIHSRIWEEFFEPGPDQDLAKGRNFVIKAYVFGDYLNDNVSLERGEFRFQTDTDLLNGISQNDIEQKAAEIAQSAVGAEIAERKKRKEVRIAEYVTNDAPWTSSLQKRSISAPCPCGRQIRTSNFISKRKIRAGNSDTNAGHGASEWENPDELGEKIAQLIEKISDNSNNDLIYYVSMRKCVLELFSKSLEVKADGKHKSEGEVHDIIMPRKKDSEELNYDAHNLWILDERLNFTSYMSSDKPLKSSEIART